MAKPVVGDENSERLHMRISPEEIASIDDWRFANRVGTRSEAVRRLLQIGLRADARSVEIAEATGETFQAASTLWDRILEDLEAGRHSLDDVAKIALALFSGPLKKSFEASEAAAALLRDTNAFHRKAGAEDEIEKAMKATEEYKAIAEARAKMGIFG